MIFVSNMMKFALKMMICVYYKWWTFCIWNDDSCIKSDKLCIQNVISIIGVSFIIINKSFVIIIKCYHYSVGTRWSRGCFRRRSWPYRSSRHLCSAASRRRFFRKEMMQFASKTMNFVVKMILWSKWWILSSGAGAERRPYARAVRFQIFKKRRMLHWKREIVYWKWWILQTRRADPSCGGGGWAEEGE